MMLSLLLCTLAAQGSATPGPKLDSRQLQGPGPAGHSVQAQIGELNVPQFHDDPGAGSLQLAFVVLPSSAARPGPPTFFLNGIPDAATDLATDPVWNAYRELGDVVLIDQRGAGRSVPQLTWTRPPWRADLFLAQRDVALENLRATARAIRAFTHEHGVDLSAFNTRESARDVDLVRAALGYESMNVVGHSGGSHLGFEVLRRFEPRVEKFVSLGTASPDEIHSLPGDLDRFLKRISRLAAQDERIGRDMPDLYPRLARVVESLESTPLTFQLQQPQGAGPIELSLGRQGLQFLLMLELGDPEDLALFPRLVFELEQGRSDVLRYFVELRYRQLEDFPALLFVNRGASGATAERWTRIRDEARTSPFGSVRCLFFPEIAQAFEIADLGDAFRQPVESRVPALFVSASLDGKTPPRQAERARLGFPDSTHLLLENGGHNDLVDRPAVHEHIVSFLAGSPPQDETIVLPPMRFALLEGPDPLVDHPAID